MDDGSGRLVETRDRLRAKLDILARYEQVLRDQLDSLEGEDLDAFGRLAEERDALGEQLLAVQGPAPDEATGASGSDDPLGEDLETARLMAEIHMRSSELRALDSRVLGALESRRQEARGEITRTSTPVRDGAVRYMEAESGPDGPDRLDVVL